MRPYITNFKVCNTYENFKPAPNTIAICFINQGTETAYIGDNKEMILSSGDSRSINAPQADMCDSTIYKVDFDEAAIAANCNLLIITQVQIC